MLKDITTLLLYSAQPRKARPGTRTVIWNTWKKPAIQQLVYRSVQRRPILPLGTNATFCFEDRLTMQYQVQEMLRIERIFEAAGINDELAAYNLRSLFPN